MGTADYPHDRTGGIATFEVDLAYPRAGDDPAQFHASLELDADEVEALLRALAECIRVGLLAGRLLEGL